MLPQIAQRIGIPFLLLLMALAYFLEVRGQREQDLLLIKPVFYLLAILFFINAATDLRDILRERGRKAAKSGEKEPLKKILLFAALTVALVAALPHAGFLVSATLFIFCALFMSGVGNRAILYAMPVCVSLALYVIFEYVFGVELPAGFLGF
ncbi:MAG: tripartite tricarboxylate transporter TctB family protein [Candidatus Accumulibacter sp.]|jgi:cell division protein FtsW (lipid II flippase)|nr:tripartite tricarboxylate transporter TctB family protein [Accumulibacter sp.]